MKRYFRCIKSGDPGWTVGKIYVEIDKALIDDQGERRLSAKTYNSGSTDHEFIPYDFKTYYEAIDIRHRSTK